jgi:hypothetical protein
VSDEKTLSEILSDLQKAPETFAAGLTARATHIRRAARVARATGAIPRSAEAIAQLERAKAAAIRGQAECSRLSRAFGPPNGCCPSCAGHGAAFDEQEERCKWLAMLLRKHGDVRLAKAVEVGAWP